MISADLLNLMSILFSLFRLNTYKYISNDEESKKDHCILTKGTFSFGKGCCTKGIISYEKIEGKLEEGFLQNILFFYRNLVDRPTYLKRNQFISCAKSLQVQKVKVKLTFLFAASLLIC